MSNADAQGLTGLALIFAVVVLALLSVGVWLAPWTLAARLILQAVVLALVGRSILHLLARAVTLNAAVNAERNPDGHRPKPPV